MKRKYEKSLSEEGVSLLNDPAIYSRLEAIAKKVGATPEEYLIRFEQVLNKTPDLILCIFEKQAYNIR